MSMHIAPRPLYVGYSPHSDIKWKPEGMIAGRWYPVWGYENGTIKLSDGKKGEAMYFHFVLEDGRCCRLIQNNAVIAFGNKEYPYDNRDFPKAQATKPGDEPGF